MNMESTLVLWIGTPLIGAVIGWFTNYLAVKMLFRPRKPIRLLLFTVQGLVPKRRMDLAESIAHIVENELVNAKDLKEKLISDANLEKMAAVLKEKVSFFLDQQIEKLPPMMKVMMPEGLVAGIGDSISSELATAMPELLAQFLEQSDQANHIHEIVRDKINELDLDILEKMIFKIAGQELRHIEILGGLLGAIIGLANVGVYYLISYVNAQ